MPDTVCPNCNAALRSADHYCSNCGQEVFGDGTLRSFVEQFLGDYFTFDSKIIRSVVPLMLRPGFLTLEFMAGRRARYIPPLRMFIFLSILFFLVIGWSGAGTDGRTAVEELQDQVFWDHFFTSILPKLFFLFLPLFAVLVHVLHRKRGASYVQPFIFSAHFHAFVFLAFTIYGLLSRMFITWGLVHINQALISFFLLYTVWYLWMALRNVYRATLGPQLLRAIALCSLYMVCLVLSAVLAVWLLR